ncbi:MAG: glycosyltransferase family 9 protein [Candidatus Omnitrophica bacterium]|nr:glycosyltransferase family 9 protein [Candidatus Omnitrophota bacterium]
MKVENIKKIDFWLGVPLCFLLTFFNLFKKAAELKKSAVSPVRKIAFIKLSELGAIILSYPLISRVKKEHPQAALFFVTFRRNQGVFKLLNGIIPQENILAARQALPAFFLDILRIIFRLRKEKIDMIFDLEFFSRASAILAYLAGSKKRTGFYAYGYEGLYRGELLTHKAQYNPLRHISANYLSLAEAAGQIGKNTPELEKNIGEKELVFPAYSAGDGIKEKVSTRLKNMGIEAGKNRVFLINPGEGILPLREWPVENFIALSRLILEDKNNRIILVGTESVTVKAGLVLEAVGKESCVSLADQTTLDELLCLFNLADALVSNDCGLGHLAMLSTISKVIIFGPESPQVFAPLGKNTHIVYSDWPCSPCFSVLNHRNSSCRDNKCLKSIKPEAVYQRLKESLKSG